ncbi:MAG TPA: rhomboid family intramembrane serine protease [Terriglobia bacterium]|jgi:membrane associated rhomboid family serine protease|nr:rhomboid family intramembrane serine protease [Terriglobia bacterium]
MCPSCRGLIDRGARVCPLCGAATGPLRARGSSNSGNNRILGIIPIPGTASATLIAVNIAFYGLSWYLTVVAASAEAGSNPGFGGIDARVLVRLGAKYGPLIYAGQWWRLVTAMFLHAGIFHIGMNLWCLFDLGPMAESLFTKSKFIVLYLVTGVVGFIFSLLWSPGGVSIGASGAILGLVGVLIGASFHHGGLGKTYRAQLWRWVIYIFIFGLFFPVDNAAHLGGLVSGLLLGYMVPQGEPQTRNEEVLWGTLGVVATLVIVASFALMALSMNSGFAG